MKALTATSSVVAITMICLLAQDGHGLQERLLLDATINGSPSPLYFDSCSDMFALYPDGPRKFGISWTPTPTNVTPVQGSPAILGKTEPCMVSFLGFEGRKQLHMTRFYVLDVPPYWDQSDVGMIPWRAVSEDVFSLDAEDGKLKAAILPPKDTDQWSQLRIRTELSILALEAKDKDGIRGAILIDTGSPLGVLLPPSRWLDWKAQHPQMPMTFRFLFTPGEGGIVMEEGWAGQISVGTLVLSNVPVMQWPRTYTSNDVAILGFCLIPAMCKCRPLRRWSIEKKLSFPIFLSGPVSSAQELVFAMLHSNQSSLFALCP